MKPKNSLLKQMQFADNYQSKKHSEDCLDANDDTSVFRGICICPRAQSAPTHTPTPWQLASTDPRHSIKVIQASANGTTKYFIAETIGSHAVDHANAAYIVQCVNSHADLLEIAKVIKGYFDNNSVVNGCLLVEEEKTLAQLVSEVIARAEGK